MACASSDWRHVVSRLNARRMLSARWFWAAMLQAPISRSCFTKCNNSDVFASQNDSVPGFEWFLYHNAATSGNLLSVKWIWQTVGGRAAAMVCPLPSPPPVGAEALAPPSRRQRSSSFPRPTRSHAHRCSRLTRQHDGEQISLVTLTFDLESGVRVTCDVGYLCAKILVFLSLCSRLTPDVRDRQTSDRQIDIGQKHRLMPPPIRGGA